ncbi:IclR family transcriptional regulator [Neoroseomonas lacus]|uniref:IclR family transcriptional regulator n=2 Tax=Neoroseomonas lacus TaxID=287609 RepID=A0A917KLL5_9PROT|nr:IclR family transcriptional regulator [Neoroseomonas lacus]
MKTTKTPEAGQVTVAMARGLEVLLAFAADDEWLGNAELAARTGLPKPTVTRATNTLVETGFLEPDPASQRFRLGPSALVLAGRVTNFASLRVTLRPILQGVVKDTGASVGAVHADRGELTYFEYCRSDGPIAISLGTGSRVAMLHSAAASAMLSVAAPLERERLLADASVHGPDEMAALVAQAARGAAEMAEFGHCRSFGLWHPHVNSIAVPYRVPVTGMLTAITAAGPIYAMTPEHLVSVVAPRLQAAVADLQRRFGL